MERLNGKRVLVTGGTGFVGSHLVEALIDCGASVVVPYRSLDPFSYFTTRGFAKKVILAIADVKEGQRIFDLVTKYEIDYIFHLAALATVPTAYENPLETIVTNVLGTANILEAARKTSRVKGVIVASSDKAYGKSKRVYVEEDALRGDHPYEASKSSADLIALSYAKTYNLPIVVTRFGNIYGEGDLHFNRIIPGALKAAITNSTLELRSDGTFVRDFVYVKDVVGGYLFLINHIEKATGEAYNLSSEESLTVIEVIKVIEKIINKKVPYSILNNQINEIPYQHLNYQKINKLGWTPKYNLKISISDIYTWYQKYFSKSL
ncbi:NAD-dependent epimerase/dehydratase family protein [Candidatus Gottesmanbacteria bacterium]|nr:NAD-dependent epimerase/dehydratase family protein [Candidatus Gottesmanbacteria bacterium]